MNTESATTFFMRQEVCRELLMAKVDEFSKATAQYWLAVTAEYYSIQEAFLCAAWLNCPMADELRAGTINREYMPDTWWI